MEGKQVIISEVMNGYIVETETKEGIRRGSQISVAKKLDEALKIVKRNLEESEQ